LNLLDPASLFDDLVLVLDAHGWRIRSPQYLVSSKASAIWMAK
jgi:hypothetical protein